MVRSRSRSMMAHAAPNEAALFRSGADLQTICKQIGGPILGADGSSQGSTPGIERQRERQWVLGSVIGPGSLRGELARKREAIGFNPEFQTERSAFGNRCIHRTRLVAGGCLGLVQLPLVVAGG